MKRIDHRARVSASIINRTAAAIRGLHTVNAGSGASGGGTLVYHAIGAGVARDWSAWSCSGSGWTLDKAVKPRIGVITGKQITDAYNFASIIRATVPELDWVDAGDFLYTGLALPFNAIPGGGSTGWVFGDKNVIEDAGAVEVTYTPDNWTYPGGYCMGSPFTTNPVNSVGSIGWSVPPSGEDEEWEYYWYPPYSPPVGLGDNLVRGGSVIGGDLYNPANLDATIKVDATSIPWFQLLKAIPDGSTITRAWLPLTMSDIISYRKVFTASSFSDPGDFTTDTTTLTGMSLSLVGGARRGGEVIWEPVGGGVTFDGADGKTRVVDATGLAARILELRSSTYHGIALIPSGYADLTGATDARQVLRALCPDPVLTWDAVALDWYISEAYQNTLSWSTATTGALYVEFQYPSGEDGCCTIPNHWPQMAPIGD